MEPSHGVLARPTLSAAQLQLHGSGLDKWFAGRATETTGSLNPAERLLRRQERSITEQPADADRRISGMASAWLPVVKRHRW